MNPRPSVQPMFTGSRLLSRSLNLIRRSSLSFVLGLAIAGTGAQAANYTWTAMGTADWASGNWAGVPEIDPSVGPTIDDDIFFNQTTARVTSLKGDRSANTITSTATVAWTFQAGAAGASYLFSNTMTVNGTSLIQLRNGNALGTLDVELNYLILDGPTGAAFTGGGSAASETAVNYLNGLVVNTETRIVKGTANFNVRNVDNTSNSFSLGLLNMTAGTVNLNHSYYTKNAEVSLSGISGVGGTITGASIISGGANTGTTSVVLTANSNYTGAAVLSDGVTGGQLVLTKSGTGTQTLTGDSTYTGGTTITAGGLQLGDGGETGSIVGNVAMTGEETVLTFNRSNELAFSGTISGLGEVVQSGMGTTVLSAANSYSGGTTISAGMLLATNGAGSATGSGAVLVEAAGTLGGTGFIAPDAGNSVIINGTLSPGADGDILTFAFDGSSKLEFGADSFIDVTLGTSSDLITFVTAGDWLSGSGNATLALTLGSGFSYDASYVIFQNVTTADFALAGVTGYNVGGYVPVFSQVGDDYVLSFTAVPEPSAWALLGLAGGGLVAGLKRKKARL